MTRCDSISTFNKIYFLGSTAEKVSHLFVHVFPLEKFYQPNSFLDVAVFESYSHLQSKNLVWIHNLQ